VTVEVASWAVSTPRGGWVFAGQQAGRGCRPDAAGASPPRAGWAWPPPHLGSTMPSRSARVHPFQRR